MLNRNGGIEGDMIINMIDSGDGNLSISPNFEGKGHYNRSLYSASLKLSYS